MLPDKPWSLEVIARLLAGIFACLMLGQLTLLMLRYQPDTPLALSPGWFFLETGTAFVALLGALVTLARPWTAAAFRARGITLLICFYAALSLMSFAQRGSGSSPAQPSVLGMVITAVGFQGSAILLIWFLARQQGWRLREAFGLSNAPRAALTLGLTAAFACVPVGLGLNFALAAIAGALGIKLPVQDAVLIVRLADSWTDRIALASVTILLAPLAEEALFRGIALPSLRRVLSPKLAVWVSSIVFAAFHLNVLTFIPLLLFALVLSHLYQRSGNLLAPIVCHATFNAANFVLLFISDKIMKQPLSAS